MKTFLYLSAIKITNEININQQFKWCHLTLVEIVLRANAVESVLQFKNMTARIIIYKISLILPSIEQINKSSIVPESDSFNFFLKLKLFYF